MFLTNEGSAHVAGNLHSNQEKIMQFEQFIQSGSFALSEGSIYERLRRNPTVEFDPFLDHAALIYNPKFASVLEQVHREYLDEVQRYQLLMFTLTDTWRANQERIQQSQSRNRKVNQDNACFVAQIRKSYGAGASPIFIGGLIGPKGDAYTPEEALAADEDETELNIVHVFTDADALDKHNEGVAERARGAFEFLEPISRELYGMPSEKTLAMMTGVRPPGAPEIEVHHMPKILGGYIRFKAE